MLRRELAIALGARVTWLSVALAALLVGHSFVLAVDLFTAGARSVAAGSLMAREYDPLLGIVRPTLGGLYLAASLLAPLIAARPIAVEHERRSLRVLLLQTAAPVRLLLAKYLAALSACALLFFGPVGMLILWRAVGGHLALGEILGAMLGHALYLALIAAVATAAAAWTTSVAQATAATLVVVLGSWAIDAAEGFAALAWLGPAADWSLTTHLAPFEHGVLSLGDCGWFMCGAAGALALALVGLRFDMSARWRSLAIIGVALGTIVSMRLAVSYPRVLDATELRRMSLPPAVATALHTISGPLSLTIYLDRDDARRRQLESDVISKLRLARPDLRLRYPTDERPLVKEGEREEGYGRITLCVGPRCTDTYSGSRKELVTLLFETAGQPLPDWSQPAYPGYPLIVEGQRRTALAGCCYFLLPGICVALGLWLTRPRRRFPKASSSSLQSA